jgi:hypothetical protein
MKVITTGLARVVDLMKNWKPYRENVQAQVMYDGADSVLAEMLQRVPSGKEFSDYKRSLELFQLGSKGEGFGVRADPKGRRVKKIEVQQSLIFIKAKRQMKKPKRAVVILERHSPWTADTIPFMPHSADATVILRKTTKRDVKFVAKARSKDRRVWLKALAKAGVKPSKKPVPISAGMTAVPDSVFTGMGLEFGLGNQKPFPHWRPAIHRLMQSSLKKIVRKRAITSAFSDLDYTKSRNVDMEAEEPPYPRRKTTSNGSSLRSSSG